MQGKPTSLPEWVLDYFKFRDGEYVDTEFFDIYTNLVFHAVKNEQAKLTLRLSPPSRDYRMCKYYDISKFDRRGILFEVAQEIFKRTIRYNPYKSMSILLRVFMNDKDKFRAGRVIDAKFNITYNDIIVIKMRGLIKNYIWKL